MTEEELTQLRQENRLLREQTGLQHETISLQKNLIDRLQEQITLLERERSLQQQQMSQLSEQVKELQEQLAKNSHNSSLPPSSDRFVRQPKSLRTKSGKQTGGQEGHPGTTLRFSQAPDEVIEHLVSVCASCQHDLREVEACVTLRRQVVDVPSPRLIVQEHRAEQKQCP